MNSDLRSIIEANIEINANSISSKTYNNVLRPKRERGRRETDRRRQREGQTDRQRGEASENNKHSE